MLMTAFVRALFVILLITFTVLADDNNKYFHEPAEDDLHRHYDARYFTGLVTDEERQITLRAMIRAYLLLFRNFQLETWIAHGTLLGWYWNAKILPWDWDLDAQVTNTTLATLAQKHNHTYWDFRSHELNITRQYLLDINPWFWERVRGDGANIIDGRFIDLSNGLFLDITGLAANDVNNTNVVECKNEHRYNLSDIFPLRKSTFEGASAKVPYAYAQVLADEYTSQALTQNRFHNHTFDTSRGEWLLTADDVEDSEEVAPEGGAFS